MAEENQVELDLGTEEEVEVEAEAPVTEEKKEVDNISQKTGATKFTENEMDIMSNANYNS